jgi:hypothetical protein
MTEAAIDCRLCGAPARWVFARKILGKYEAGYYRCDACASLQTEAPHWLDEAYANSLSCLDTGAAQRTLDNLAVCFFIAKLYGLTNVIDFGGGDGLLCRFLRDYGLNAYVTDKYAAPAYAQGFTEPDFRDPDLVIASEVVEHLPNPATDLDGLFGLNPRIVFVATGVYADQPSDWWYLSPESGQHVFFYSRKALRHIADRYGYGVLANGDFILFVRPELRSPLRSALSRLVLRRKIVRLLRSMVVFLPASHAWNDYLLQRNPGRRSR